MSKQQIQSASTVAIFGEVLADVFPDQSVLGGAPYNVARHLQAFGLNPVMISSIGNDALGDALLDEMGGLGMDTSGMQFDVLHPTGQVKVHLENGNHSYEILPEQAYDHISVAITHETVIEVKPVLAYFGSLAQRGIESRLAAERFLQVCACPKFFDINLRAPWYDKQVIVSSLAAADIVKMNDEELKVLAEMFSLASTNPQAQSAELQQRFALGQVLVSCGSAGSWLLDERQQILAAQPVEMQQPFVDSVGAGDAYAAVFILGYLMGWDTQLSLQRASEFASAICTQRGAAAQSIDFYRPFKAAWFA